MRLLHGLLAVLVIVLLSISAFSQEKITIADKTLVAWASFANLSQRGGSLLTIERGNGVFDAIVFGEVAAGKWMAGSNGFQRTQKIQNAAAETADNRTLVQIAIVYKGKQITIYRDGKIYAAYDAKQAERFGDDSNVVMGLRHLGALPENSFFLGSIDDARIYGVALDAEQIGALKPNQPSEIKPLAWWDFEEGKAVDRMGRFPATTLVGDARIVGGRLHLDRQGAYLFASRGPMTLTAKSAAADSGDVDATSRLHRERMLKDASRAGYHFVAPEGRCMPFDPNGAIFWKGRYHLFYIFQDARGHNWGHVSSTDLVHWRHHPTTLLSGMFSGNCFVNKEGRPTMCHHNTNLGGNVMVESIDDNLEVWRKPQPITPKASDPLSGTYRSWDPFGTFENGRYYAVFGGTRPGVATCDRIDGDWKYVGDLFAHPVAGIGIDEDVSCADIFRLGNTDMLLCISHRLGARYYLGNWKNAKFYPKFHERMSWVDNSFFAPRSLIDDKGRRIMWAWIFDGPGFVTRKEYGWSGTMSLPRVLTIAADGTLRMNPIEELERLRYNPRKKTDITVPAGTERPLADIVGNSIEIAVEMTSEAKQFGLKVCCSPVNAEETAIFYDAVDKKLKIDTSKSSLKEGPKTTEAGPFELKPGEPLKLRVFVDKSVVEVFANGRQAVMRRIYPSRPDSLGVSLYAVGGPATATVLEAWDMMPSNPY